MLVDILPCLKVSRLPTRIWIWTSAARQWMPYEGCLGVRTASLQMCVCVYTFLCVGMSRWSMWCRLSNYVTMCNYVYKTVRCFLRIRIWSDLGTYSRVHSAKAGAYVLLHQLSQWTSEAPEVFQCEPSWYGTSGTSTVPLPLNTPSQIIETTQGWKKHGKNPSPTNKGTTVHHGLIWVGE